MEDTVRRTKPATFREALRQAREDRGMTQQALGEAIGLGGRGATVQVSRWETGVCLPAPATVHDLGAVLRVDLSDMWVREKFNNRC